MTLIILALAGTRLTRAWLHENVGEPFRERLETWMEPDFEETDVPGEMRVADSARMLRLKGYVEDLITCPHCIGFHFTLVCSIAYRFRHTRPVVLALAGAALHSVIVEHYPAYDPEEDDDG